jgi:effector-binding domain-containing protein
MAQEPQVESESLSRPEFVVGQVRLQPTSPFTFFRVGDETTRAEADTALDALMEDLSRAVESEGLAGPGPVVLVCQSRGEELYLEAGYAVQPEVAPASSARVRTVPGAPCASLLYWGSLRHYPKAHEALWQGIQQAGLTYGNELREWYLHFEGDDSPNNVILLQYVLSD